MRAGGGFWAGGLPNPVPLLFCGAGKGGRRGKEGPCAIGAASGRLCTQSLLCVSSERAWGSPGTQAKGEGWAQQPGGLPVRPRGFRRPSFQRHSRRLKGSPPPRICWATGAASSGCWRPPPRGQLFSPWHRRQESERQPGIGAPAARESPDLFPALAPLQSRPFPDQPEAPLDPWWLGAGGRRVGLVPLRGSRKPLAGRPACLPTRGGEEWIGALGQSPQRERRG